MVARDTMLGCIAARGQGGMPDRCKRVGMPIVGVAVDNALAEEITKPAFAKAFLKAQGHIATKLVHHEEEDKLGLGCRCTMGAGRCDQCD